MRVLVTRPRGQAEATAAALRARGHLPVIDPVLEIEPVQLPPIDLAEVAAIVITSANAVPAVTPAMRPLPLFCVGEATAAAARSAGLTPAGIGDDDGFALARLVAARLSPEDGPVLHLCGQDLAPSTGDGLRAAGFAYRPEVAYRAVAAHALQEGTCDMMRRGGFDAVLFFSPRTARTWCALVGKAGLQAATQRSLAACLSPAVAEAASSLRWRRVAVAKGRDQTALLDCLDGPG
jgi:uroporphyrinogen-III synthase